MRARLLGVSVLCILSGSGWLLRDAWPSRMEWPFDGCIHYALVALVGTVFLGRGKGWTTGAIKQMPRLMLAGLCLLVLPTTVLHFVAGKVPEFTSVAMFSAVPLMTVVAAASFGSEAGDGLRLRVLMAPSIAGLGGALLLFPVSAPGTLRRWLFLGLVLGVCVVVAAASVWMHHLMKGVDVAAAVSVTGFSSATMLGLYGLSNGGFPEIGLKAVADELLRCAALDLPEVWLLVWLMRDVSPVRLSARFLLVPLVTVVEGYVVQRGRLDGGVVLGISLLCGGGLTMLLRDEPEEPAGLRLR